MNTEPQTTDPLVPASEARHEWGNISIVTEWRWREAGILPRPHRIRGRNYYLRSEIEGVKAAAGRPEGLRADPAAIAILPEVSEAEVTR